MGMFERRKTQAEMAPTSTAVAARGALGLEQVLQIDGAIRCASLSSIEASEKSGTVRGKQSNVSYVLGAGDIPSTLWFERTEFTKWTISKGADSTTGNHMDWQVEFLAKDTPAGPVVETRTPHAMTRNDVIEKAASHKKLRGDADRYVRGEATPGADRLREVSKAGLTLAVGAITTSVEPVNSTQRISTNRPGAMVDEALRHLPATIVSRSGNDCCYHLGIPGQSGGTALVRWDDSPSAIIEIELTVALAGNILTDAVASLACRRFTDDVLAVLRLDDRMADVIDGEESHEVS